VDHRSQRNTWRALLALILVAASAGGCAVPGLQAYWDAEISRLCEKDGGVRIFSKVTVTHADFVAGIDGGIVPLRWSSRQDEPYFVIPDRRRYPRLVVYESPEIRTTLHGWNPEVWRSERRYMRASDNELVATSVSYFRIGGDIVVIDHPTGIHCPKAGESNELAKMFVVR